MHTASAAVVHTFTRPQVVHIGLFQTQSRHSRAVRQVPPRPCTSPAKSSQSAGTNQSMFPGDYPVRTRQDPGRKCRGGARCRDVQVVVENVEATSYDNFYSKMT